MVPQGGRELDWLPVRNTERSLKIQMPRGPSGRSTDLGREKNSSEKSRF